MHLLVGVITFQQLFAVAVEVGVGKAVVFHDYASLHLVEEPGDARHGAGTAAPVFAGVVGVEVYRRVFCHGVHNFSHLGTLDVIVFIAFAGSVLKDVEVFGLCVKDRFQHFLGVGGTVESDEQYGCVEHVVCVCWNGCVSLPV